MSTTTFKGSTIMIKGPNAGSDWTLANAGADINRLEPGVRVNFISFTPGASRDGIVITDRNEAGPIIAKFECASSTDQKIIYFEGAFKKPYIDTSIGTYGQTSSSIVQIELM